MNKNSVINATAVPHFFTLKRNFLPHTGKTNVISEPVWNPKNPIPI